MSRHLSLVSCRLSKTIAPMLDPQWARRRQQRLLEATREQNLDAIVLGLPHHVYYYTTFLPSWLHHAAFVSMKDGTTWLTSARTPAEHAAVDQKTSYPA